MQGKYFHTILPGKGADGKRGVKHVVYWKQSQEPGAQPLKVNITVYDNDILQVVIVPTVHHVHHCYVGERVQLLALGVGVLPCSFQTSGAVHLITGKIYPSNNFQFLL